MCISNLYALKLAKLSHGKNEFISDHELKISTSKDFTRLRLGPKFKQ